MTVEAVEQDDLRTVIARLARPDRSGGSVIERASLQASGVDFTAALEWIEAHGGAPEAVAAPARGRGLHSARQEAHAADRVPLRFILPAGALA